MDDQVWINFKIPRELKTKLSAMAEEDDRTMSSFLRSVLSAEWEKREEKKLTLQPVED